MSLLLGSILPNIDVETTYGKMKLHDYQGDNWLLFFSHPADYTPVCTTELSRLVTLLPEFTRRNVKLIALSCDNVEDHKLWGRDIMSYCDRLGEPLPFPIIADPNRDIAIAFGILDPTAKDSTGLPQTCRACFIYAPDKTLRLSSLYPSAVGRNFHEIVRTIDALQLHVAKHVVTPVDWKDGDRVIVPPGAPADNYPSGVETVTLPSGKPYLRFTTVSK